MGQERELVLYSGVNIFLQIFLFSVAEYLKVLFNDLFTAMTSHIIDWLAPLTWLPKQWQAL